MSESPAVSVIVPLFNKRESVARTIESVLRQTVQDIEVLVVDDGSTDGSGEIVEAVGDPRLRLMRQPNAGPNEARNNGVRAARADLVAFVDADDEWTAVHLENILKTRNRFPRCGVYATNFCWVLPDRTRKHPNFPGLQAVDDLCVIDNYFAVSKTSSILTCSSVAMTKEVLDDLGGFPPTEFVKQAHALWIKVALNYQVGFCLEPTLVYHLDAENRWDAHIKKIRSNLKDCDTVLLGTLDDALAHRNYRNRHVRLEDIRNYRRQALFWRASDLIRIGQINKGRAAALRSLVGRGYFLRSLKLIVRTCWRR